MGPTPRTSGSLQQVVPRSARRLSLRAAVLVLLAAGLLVAGIAAATGALSSSAATADDGAAPVKRLTAGCREDAVRFGIVLDDDDRSGRRAAAAIAADIGRQIGCQAIVVTRPTQSALLAALALHQVDFAQVDPAVLAVGERTVALTVMGAYSAAADTAARVGDPPRLWARDDGPVASLEDARGRRVALGPALTVAGDLAPRAALLAAGATTAATVPELASEAAVVTRPADDAQALRGLSGGDVDVALTRGPVTDAQRRGLRALWTGEAPLADLLVLRPGVPNDVRRLLLSAVRDVPGALLAPLAERQGIDQPIPLLPVPPELYDPVSDQLDALTAGGLVP